MGFFNLYFIFTEKSLLEECCKSLKKTQPYNLFLAARFFYNIRKVVGGPLRVNLIVGQLQIFKLSGVI